MKTSILIGTLITFTLVFSHLNSSAQYSWDEIEELPGSGRERVANFVIGDEIFVVSGRDETGNITELFAFNTETGDWEQKADLPNTPVRNGAGFSIGTKGYLIGGYDGTSVTTNCWEYDSTSDTWTQLNDFPGGPICSFSSGISGGDHGYIAFGRESVAVEYSSDIWEYTAETDSWENLTSIPSSPRWRAVGEYLNGKLYVGCGTQTNISQFQDFWEYDLVADEWTELAEYPSNLTVSCFHFTINDKIYVGEGFDEDDSAVIGDLVYSFDPSENTWEVEEDFTRSERINGFGTAVNDTGYYGLGRNYQESIYYSDFYEFANEIVSINEVQSDFVRFYPNPSTGIIHLEGDTTIKIEVLDSVGRLIHQKSISSSEKTLDLSFLTTGAYVIRFENETSQFSRTLLIE